MVAANQQSLQHEERRMRRERGEKAAVSLVVRFFQFSFSFHLPPPIPSVHFMDHNERFEPRSGKFLIDRRARRNKRGQTGPGRYENSTHAQEEGN